MKPKQLLNTFRLHDKRYLVKINTLEITDFTADQVAKAIRLIEREPGLVWMYEKIEEEPDLVIEL